MDWITLLRDQVFETHPLLYSIVIVGIGVYILHYVFEHEKKLKKQQANRRWEPFRKR